MAFQAAAKSSGDFQAVMEELDKALAFRGPGSEASASGAAASGAAASSAAGSWQAPDSTWGAPGSWQAPAKEEPASSWGAAGAASWGAASWGAAGAAAKEELKEEEAVAAAYAAATDAFDETAQQLGAHPWAVRPTSKGRSHDLTDEERARLRSEKAASSAARVPWQERGPAQVYDQAGQPATQNWRGQGWRTGSQGGKQRYANRGGQYKDYYRDLNRRGLLQATPNGAQVLKKPRTAGQGTTSWDEL